MTNLINNIWAVQVPEGAKELHTEVDLKEMPYVGYKFKDDELLNEYQSIYLPPGQWEIVCTSKEVTVEQAREVVEIQDELFYKCYNGNRPHITITASFKCLLTSRGLDLNKQYIILIKLNSKK